METMRTIARPRLVRSLALFWIIFGLAGAYVQAARAWTALVSGQTTLPLMLHDPGPVVRTTEPLVFHATLFALLLIALAFLYAAYGAWRLRQATRPRNEARAIDREYDLIMNRHRRPAAMQINRIRF